MKSKIKKILFTIIAICMLPLEVVIVMIWAVSSAIEIICNVINKIVHRFLKLIDRVIIDKIKED